MRKLDVVILSILTCILGAPHFSAQTEARPNAASDLVLRGSRTAWPVHQLRPVSLPDGRLVLSIANTVYMLDEHGKQLWKYENEGLTAEPAFNAVRNEIAVIMYDLQAVRLDATTGKVKWKANAVGRGLFTSVSPYGNGFLVVVDMSGYRDNLSPQVSDRLEYWGDSDKEFWYIDFPKHAELVVNGKAIYALFRDKSNLRLREMRVPGSHSPPQ